MKPELYRTAALDELSSPEQLDVLLQIIPSPRGTVVAAVFLLAAALAVVWLLGAGS